MRNVFDSVRDMANFLLGNHGRISKQTPYRVEIDGVVRYVFSGNSDQAVAAVTRSVSTVNVTAVGLRELMTQAEEEKAVG